MAFQSKDGKKKFGSAYVAKRYDSMHSGDEAPHSMPMAGEGEKDMNAPKKPMESKAAPRDPEKDVDKAGMGEDNSPASVVAQHGKATSVHVKHDHVANKHHVTSMHEDGHVHESDHGSAQEAHDEAKQLGGEANTENSDSMANEEQEGGGDLFGGGTTIPRMA